MTRVQNLDEAVCILDSVNTLDEGILPLARGK